MASDLIKRLHEVEVSVTKLAITVDKNPWIQSDTNKSLFTCEKFSLLDATEKEDKKDYWKLYGPGVEVSGDSPEACIESLKALYNDIGYLIHAS
jgi:hypothetical protein